MSSQNEKGLRTSLRPFVGGNTRLERMSFRAGQRTGRHDGDCQDSIGAGARARGRDTDVSGRAVEVGIGRRIRVGFLLFEGPSGFGAVNLLEIGDASGPL